MLELIMKRRTQFNLESRIALGIIEPGYHRCGKCADLQKTTEYMPFRRLAFAESNRNFPNAEDYCT